MKFTLITRVAHPCETVFEAQRDHLPDMVSHIPNVDSIERLERVEEGNVVRLRNRWKGSSSEIPGIVRPFLKPEWLEWQDQGVWKRDLLRCEWQTTLNVFPGALVSRGMTTFEDDGAETIVKIVGEFSIDPMKVRGVPMAVTRTVAPAIERFVVGILEPNMKQSFAAVESWLDERA